MTYDRSIPGLSQSQKPDFLFTIGINGKVALITSSAQRIGKATAIAFTNEGAMVIVSDIKKCDHA
jgi:hypothetical protein